MLPPKVDLGGDAPNTEDVLPNAFGTEDRFENADTGAVVGADADVGAA